MNTSIYYRFISLWAVLFITLSFSLIGQPFGLITIDEDFSDWDASMDTFVDGVDNPGGNDLLNFQVTNDQHFLYIKFTLDQEVALADDLVQHTLWLCMDTDNDPATGYPQQAGYGTELAINFNQHYAWFNPPGNSIQVGFGDIQLRPAPTVTSSTFELAIPRDIQPDSIHPLFTGDTIRVLIKDDAFGDKMPNEGTIFQYVFTEDTVRISPPVSLEKEDVEDIRVVSYNVLFNRGWEDGLAEMERVVKALDADVYCFQESDDITEQEAKNYLDTWVPTGTQAGWFVSLDYSRLTCTKWEQTQRWDLNRAHAVLVDLPASYNKDFLVVNGHLSCCGANQNRQDQADEFAAFVLDAKSQGGNVDLPENTPIVFVGDMNLVGYNQQRKTILEGDIQDAGTFGAGGFPDWDNTPLTDAVPLHLSQNMAYTWRSFSNTNFPNGRLDYQFYTDAVVEQKKSFVLQTEVLPASWLATYDLDSTSTWEISDHLPVVVDYSFDKLVSISSPVPSSTEFTVYPNPAYNDLTISASRALQQIELKDLKGNVLIRSYTGEKQLDLSAIPAGMYLLSVQMDGQWHQQLLVRLQEER